MVMTNFSRSNVKVLDAAILRRLEKELAQYGICIRPAGVSYNPRGGKFSYDITLINPTDDTQSEEARSFREFARFYSLREDVLGKVFKYGNRTLAFYGYSPRSRKYPFLIEETMPGGKKIIKKFMDSTIRNWRNDKEMAHLFTDTPKAAKAPRKAKSNV